MKMVAQYGQAAVIQRRIRWPERQDGFLIVSDDEEEEEEEEEEET